MSLKHFNKTALTVMQTLFHLLHWRNNYEESEYFIRQVIARLKKTEDLDSELGLDALFYLAVSLEAQERYSEALLAVQEAFEARTRVSGPEHQVAQIAGSTLAMSLYHNGKYAESEGVARTVFTARKESLGEDHKLTRLIRYVVVASLYEQHQLEAARLEADELLASYERILGMDHPDTWWYMNELVNHEREAKDWAGWDIRISALHYQMEQKLGSNHPETIQCREMLAKGLLVQGQHSKSAIVYQELVDHYPDKFEGHVDLLGALLSLSISLCSQGQYAEAEAAAREALTGWKVLLGDSHILTFQALCCLAEVLVDSGRYSDAQSLCTPDYQRMVERLDVDHDLALQFKYILAVITAHLGGEHCALRSLRKVLRAQITVNGENSRRTLKTGYEIGNLLYRLDRHWEAEMYLGRHFHGARKEFGVNHPSTAMTCQNYIIFLLSCWKKNQLRSDEDVLPAAPRSSQVAFWPRSLPLLKSQVHLRTSSPFRYRDTEGYSHSGPDTTTRVDDDPVDD